MVDWDKGASEALDAIERYATKDEVRVIENGYLALYREHEHDLRWLRLQVWTLVVTQVLMSALLALLVLR